MSCNKQGRKKRLFPQPCFPGASFSSSNAFFIQFTLCTTQASRPSAPTHQLFFSSFLSLVVFLYEKTDQEYFKRRIQVDRHVKGKAGLMLGALLEEDPSSSQCRITFSYPWTFHFSLLQFTDPIKPH